MNQDIEMLKQFKTQMKAIARKNDDEFETIVTFDENGYHVTVTEKADGHVFLSGHGETCFIALDNTLLELPVALKEWGYEDNT